MTPEPAANGAAPPPRALDTTRAVPTPEGIELLLRLAGPVPRALAWLCDTLLRLIVLLICALVLGMLGYFGWGLILIVAFLLEWLVPAAYEVWNEGATPGKRAVGLRVLHDDGTPVGWPAALVRNLLRAVDFLPIAYGLGLLAVALNRDFKRLGDLAAGTLVVYRAPPPLETTVPQAAAAAPARPLSLAEQRAILDFAERTATLTPERAEEIARIAGSIVPAGQDSATQRLLQVANHLNGTRP